MFVEENMIAIFRQIIATMIHYAKLFTDTFVEDDQDNCTAIVYLDNTSKNSICGITKTNPDIPVSRELLLLAWELFLVLDYHEMK